MAWKSKQGQSTGYGHAGKQTDQSPESSGTDQLYAEMRLRSGITYTRRLQSSAVDDYNLVDEENRSQPLLIDVVLENVLKDFALHQLKQCRQVCRKWQDVATRVMLKQGSSCKGITSNQELLDFIKCVKKSDFIPFNKYAFSAPSLFQKKYYTVFDFCGPNMKSLAINYGCKEKYLKSARGGWEKEIVRKPLDSISIEQVMDILLCKAKNLVHLTLGIKIKETSETKKKCLDILTFIKMESDVGDAPGSYQEGLHLKFPDIRNLSSLKLKIGCNNAELKGNNFNEVFLQDLFKSLTGLRMLSMSSTSTCRHLLHEGYCFENRTTAVLNAMHLSGRDSTVTEIQFVDMTCKVVDKLIEISDVGRLKLSRMGNEDGCIYRESDLATGSKWATLFGKQSQLEAFALTTYFIVDVDDKINPTVLKSLKTLQISSFETMDEFVVAEDTPGLETLSIREGYSTFLLMNESKPTTSVTSLELENPIDIPEITRIADGFPALKHLTVTLEEKNQNDFRHIMVIWEKLSRLESLKLNLNYMSQSVGAVNMFESIMCGVPLKQMKQWKRDELWRNGKWSPLGPGSHIPLISNMKDLKQLEFQILWDYRQDYKVPNMDTLFYIILTGMSNLEKVVLDEVQISDHCRQQILKHSKILKWKSSLQVGLTSHYYEI